MFSAFRQAFLGVQKGSGSIMFKKLSLLVLLLMSVTLAIYADTLKLKDGSSIEATRVLDQGSKYWVKLADGTTQTINKTDVKEWVKATTPTQSSAGAGAKPSASPGIASMKAKAERTEGVVGAVALWSKWIDDNPESPDLEAAKKELAMWQQREKEGAEKVNGKWISGADRTKLVSQAHALMDEGVKMAQGNQFIEGVKKIEQSVSLYPNDFDANFELGLLYLQKAVFSENINKAYLDRAVKALEMATKLRPDDAAPWSNLAIGYNFNKQYVLAVKMAYKAAKMSDNKETVQNLVNCIAFAPEGMRKNSEIKPMVDDAIFLAQRHGIGGRTGFAYIRPTTKKDDQGRPVGVNSSGSGFVVTGDGYIITNHHVACGDAKAPIDQSLTYRIEWDDGTQKMADLIAVDEKYDMALMKVKSDKPLPYLQIADNNPKQGSKAMVLGFPALSENRFGEHALQVSDGQVKSINLGHVYEVWLNLNTTHGNSGGPIVDRGSRVVGILTAGTQVHNMEIVFGVGPNQIKDFMKRIGSSAPKLEYVSLPDNAPEFDGEALTERCRKATVYVLVIRAGDNNHKNALSVKDDGLAPDGSKRKTEAELPLPEAPKEPKEGGGESPPAEGGGGEGQGGAEGPKRSLE
jgi:S1-C subfamily serine protease